MTSLEELWKKLTRMGARQPGTSEIDASPQSLLPTPLPQLSDEEQEPVLRLNERMIARDTGIIIEGIVRHLVSLNGANVRVTLEIQAEMPDGVSEQVARTVSKNCRTLHFYTAEFERE